MRLSLSDINESAPYKVENSPIEGYVKFVTDFGVQYLIGFDVDDTTLSLTAYQLVIINTNNGKSPRDRKVKDTIIAIVESFFKQDNEILLYVCQTGDYKQSMRNRLFEYWFSTYQHKYQYAMLTSSIIDMEGVINYVALIVRNDNPQIARIMSEFSETLNLLNTKP